MAPLFSKVDLNQLWHDVQNEDTLICAKFGKDLFNISKVIGRKKVAQFFLTHSVVDHLIFRFLLCPSILELFTLKVVSCQKSCQILDAFCCPKFRWGQPFQKLYPQYHACVAHTSPGKVSCGYSY